MFNIVFWGAVINYAALFITAAAGSAVCIKSGEFNLGGEGQIYTGGFICAILLNYFSKNGLLNLPFIFIFISLLISSCFSGLIALFSALLKKYKNADFLLSSFIASSAICPIIDGLIAGPFRGNNGNLLATEFINKSFRLPKFFPPSSINLYLIISLIICISMYFFMKKTILGKQIEIFGKAKDFALYTGFSDTKIIFSSAFISGALHGITGAAAIVGMHYTCHSGFTNGMGWTALSIALISQSNLLVIMPVSFIISILVNTANQIALFNNFDFDISGLIQGIILFIISIPFIKKSAKTF